MDFAVYIAMTFLRRVAMFSRSRKFGSYPEARLVSCVSGAIRASITLLMLLSLVHAPRAFRRVLIWRLC